MITSHRRRKTGSFSKDDISTQKPDNLLNGTLVSILNSLAEGVIVADKNGRFTYFNPIAREILGIGLKNVETEEWSAVYGCFYPDKTTPYPSEQLPLARALRNEDVFNDIIYIQNPERPEGVFIEVSARPIRNSGGSVDGGTVIFHDITESIRLKEIQQQNEARIKAQFNGIPTPTYIWQFRGDDFYLTDYNNAAIDFTNGEIKELLETKLSQVHADSQIISEDFYKCYLDRTIVVREMDHEIKRTGEVRNLIMRYVYVPPDLVLVHTEDVTDRKQAEADLHHLFNAVEQTADSVIITDRQGYIQYVNPAFEITTGYTREEVIGRTPGMLKSGQHDAEFYKNLWDTLNSGRTYMGQIVNRKKNGEIYWSEQTITPMKDDAGEVTNFVSVLKDITVIRARREQEFHLNIAREIQQKLLCNDIVIPGYDIAGKTYPAVETSGDFYDFIYLQDGCIGLIVGDVSGHGIGSALIMSQTRAYLRAFIKIESDPGALLTRINAELVADLDAERFVTLIFVRLDPGRMRMDYASAGHVSGYVLDGASTVRSELESNGIPMGILNDFQYNTSDTISLKPSDTLILLTDGILEAHSPDNIEFGVERVMDAMRQAQQEKASAIIKTIYAEVNRFCEKKAQEDDITSIICKVTSADDGGNY